MPVRPRLEHVINPRFDASNQAAQREMEIELYFADQLCPTGRSCSAPMPAAGTIDAVQAVNDDSLPHPGGCVLSSVAISPFRVALQPGCGRMFDKYGSRKYGKKPMERLQG